MVTLLRNPRGRRFGKTCCLRKGIFCALADKMDYPFNYQTSWLNSHHEVFGSTMKAGPNGVEYRLW